VFKLVGDVIGLDGKSVGLGEARMIAAAQGSLTDSRVLFRLARLSMRLPNGRRKEFDIDGWVVGEDGIRGMGGRLLDPKNDPSVWKVHGVCGITEGMESIIKERLAHLVPVVQVLGNREATVVFSQSLALPDIPEQLEREESSVVYTALD
jgi:hypothetical protein